jgi:hypothetical protein
MVIAPCVLTRRSCTCKISATRPFFSLPHPLNWCVFTNTAPIAPKCCWTRAHRVSTSCSNPARSMSHPRRLPSPLAHVGGAISPLRSARTQSSLHTGVLFTLSCAANLMPRILLYACSFSCMWSTLLFSAPPCLALETEPAAPTAAAPSPVPMGARAPATPTRATRVPCARPRAAGAASTRRRLAAVRARPSRFLC